MGTLQEKLPQLTAAIESSLRSQGYSDLADQLVCLDFDRWTHDADVSAIYIYLSGQRPLNTIEGNIIGARYEGSIALEDVDGMINVDIDNFNRLTGIEVIGRADLAEQLATVRGPSE